VLLTLRQQLSRFSYILQSELFPVLESELGKLSSTARPVVAALELFPLSRFIPSSQGWNGSPERRARATGINRLMSQTTMEYQARVPINRPFVKFGTSANAWSGFHADGGASL